MIRYRGARLEMARQQRATQIAALVLESGRRLGSGSPGADRRAAIGILLLAVYAGVLAAAGASATVRPLLAVLVCATLSSIAGFAFSALGQALLAGLMSSPVHIVQTLMVCSIATQTFSIASLWRHMEWRRLPAFLIGGALGLPVGVYVLLHLAPRGFHVVVGALLVAYGAYVVVKRPIVLPQTGRLADAGIRYFDTRDPGSQDLLAHLHQILSLLYPAPGDFSRVERLRELLDREHARAEVSCFWYGKPGTDPPIIPKEWRDRLRQINAKNIETEFHTAEPSLA